MSQNFENTFRNWGAAPSATEQEKCERAEKAIRTAISASGSLKQSEITIFPQGSYRNRTNVRQDSDVDICVMSQRTFYYQLPDEMTADQFDITPSSESSYQFKNDVENALTAHFGSTAITRNNKAFDVHENTYRVDADVVATFEHRRYLENGRYLSGTELILDKAGRIVNWPHQNYDNGVAKNNRTGRRFKALVRIMKHLRNIMDDDNIPETKSINSYLLESLVWNVPDNGFGHDSYTEDLRFVLAHLCNKTADWEACKDWGEINELKYMFLGQQWVQKDANAFLNAAWNYVGFS